MNSIQTALATTTRKLHFQSATNSYRYWFQPAHGIKHSVLKIQARAKDMAAFRASRAGAAAERQADVLHIGGGWYEVTSRDLQLWTTRFGSQTDGTLIWLKQWNLRHLAGTNANPGLDVVIKHVRRIQGVDQRNPAAPAPVWTSTPEEIRNMERLNSKIQALASKFGRA